MSVLDLAMGVTDTVMAVIPRPVPSPEALARCRLISHRGEHDGRAVAENTLGAFRAAVDAGVWGIECDIRFTADDVPVICHDPSPARVFGVATPVADLSLDALRRVCPELPTLQEVIEEFGGVCHLMLEIKAEPWPSPQRRTSVLAELLGGLEPVTQYHLLSLEPSMLERVPFAPPECLLPVAETNVARMSALALARGYAGIGGHYLLLGEALRRRHAAAGQRIGTGFPASANCLRRELNRGVEWVFSNRAAALQSQLDDWRRAQVG